MKIKTTYLIIIIICQSTLLTAQPQTAWPEQIKDLEQSICLVEYFQPQFEIGEIKDKGRIKRKITGILVNNEGLVVTSDIIYPANLDIVETTAFYFSTQPLPENITVSFQRDKKIKARFLGKDEDLRMAFLQIIETEDLPEPIKFEGEDKFDIGDPVFLIQHLNGRFDFEKIVTAHNINAIIKKPKTKLLATTKINPLSAGGVVVDSKGKAIGIIYRGENYYNHYDYGYEAPYTNETLLQITPAAQFFNILDNPPKLLSQKDGSGKSWLGIQMQILTKDMSAYWGINKTNGIIINKVSPNSPAEKAGLKSGDIIVSLGELKIQGYDKKNLDVLRAYVRNLPEGDITANIMRDKKPKNLTVQLESAPKSRFLAKEYSNSPLGIGVKELTQDYIISNDLDFNTLGVWVSRIEDAGAASLGGIDINDLILRINDSEIKGLKDFEKNTKDIHKSGEEYVQIFLNRRGKTRFVFIKILPDDIR